MNSETIRNQPDNRINKIQRLSKAFLNRPWLQQVIMIVLISVLFVQVFGLLSMKILVPVKGMREGAWFTMDGPQLNFVRWDAGYYLNIVQRGYTVDGPERAFYPLYPILVVGLSQLLGDQPYWGGLIVSTLCYAAACLLLYRWITIDYSPDVARWSVLWLCVFPMSFFMIAFYAEPLLLLTSIASLYFARRGNFITSGVYIALAGATRSFAFILAVPYFVEFIIQRNFNLRSFLKFFTGGLIAPSGTVAYLVFLCIQAGNFNLRAILSSSNEFWANYYSLAWPWTTWLDGVRAALFGTQFYSGWYTGWFYRAITIHELAFALLGLVIAVWAVFHLRPSLSAYLIVSVLFFSTSHGPSGFGSMPRHIAILAPVYLAIALLTLKLSSRFRWLLIVISAILLGLLSLWFVRGGWVS